MMSKKIVLPIFLLLTLTSSAQTIENLEIIPAEPITPEQDVSVIAETIFANSSCDLESALVYQSSDTLFVEVVHDMGLATAICNSTDTIDLGTFAPGEYKVSYTLFFTGTNEILEFGDTAFAEFTVEGVNATESGQTFEQLQIYPNPATDYLRIETSIRGDFSIYDVQGRRISQFRINESPLSVPVNNLETGLYYLVPREGYFNGGKKFLVE